jgi:hypothetical protein
VDQLHAIGFDAGRTEPLLGWLGHARAELQGSPRPRPTRKLIGRGMDYYKRLQWTRRKLPTSSRPATLTLRRLEQAS